MKTNYWFLLAGTLCLFLVYCIYEISSILPANFAEDHRAASLCIVGLGVIVDLTAFACFLKGMGLAEDRRLGN